MSGLSPEIQDELVSALQKVRAIVAGHSGQPSYLGDIFEIVEPALAKLPPPVDPDVEEARKIVADLFEFTPGPETYTFRATLVALKRGRQLQIEEGKDG